MTVNGDLIGSKMVKLLISAIPPSAIMVLAGLNTTHDIVQYVINLPFYSAPEPVAIVAHQTTDKQSANPPDT